VTPLLAFYSARVRDVLLTELSLWNVPEGNGEEFFFPPANASAALLTEFGKLAGLPDLTLAQIRTTCCEFVQSIAASPDSLWASRAAVIQATAAHGVSTVVIRNYDVTTKLSQGDLLAQFVAETCILPALARAQDLVSDAGVVRPVPSSNVPIHDPQGGLLPVPASPRKPGAAHLLPPHATTSSCSSSLARLPGGRFAWKRSTSRVSEPSERQKMYEWKRTTRF